MTSSTAKYVLNATTGKASLLDLRLSTGKLSLNGQTAVVTGLAGDDVVYASLGTSVDFTSSGAGSDKLYLDGIAADYTVAKAGTVVTLTRTGNIMVNGVSTPVTSTYKVDTANTEEVVFADGLVHVSSFADATAIAIDNAAINSLSDPTAATLRTETNQVQLDSAGVLTATGLMGKLVVRGSAGVDQVFVKAGGQVDATQIGGSNDVIWLTGKWSNYVKTVTGTTLTLTRTIDGKSESVSVMSGANVTDDKLMFADGYIYTKAAMSGAGAAGSAGNLKSLSAAGGVMSSKAGEFTDVSNLGASLSTTLDLMQDDAAVAGIDYAIPSTTYVTNDAHSPLKGSYTGALEVGDKIQISLDGGVHWVDAALTRTSAGGTFTVGQTQLDAAATAAGATAGSTGYILKDGVNNIKLSVVSANGATLAADRRHEITLAQGGTVTLDTDAPTGSLSFFAAGDSALNSVEANDATLTNINLKVALTSHVKVGDTIQLQSTITGEVAAAKMMASISAAASTAVAATPADTTGLLAALDNIQAAADAAVGADATGSLSLLAAQAVAQVAAAAAHAAPADNAAAAATAATTAGAAIVAALPAAVVGNLADVGTPYTVTAADVKAGYASVPLPKTELTGAGVADEAHLVSAVFTDPAGNTSTLNRLTITVDTNGPEATFAVSATDSAGVGLLVPTSNDSNLNAAETSVLFAVSYDPALNPLTAGDTVQIINNVTKAVINTHVVTQAELNAAQAASPTAPSLYVSVNKSDIAGAVTVDGTYNLAIKTFDAAGNTYTDATLAPIVVDSIGVAASLTVSKVGTDGTTARAPTSGGNATNDQFLAGDETDVVVKIDSKGFGPGTVLKAGDHITLKTWDATLNSGAGDFTDLPFTGAAGTNPYDHLVSAAEALAGVVYISVKSADLVSGTNTLTALFEDQVGNKSTSVNNLAITKAGTVTLTLQAGITDLDVTSDIILSANQALSKAMPGGTITFTHKGFTGGAATGFDGQTTGNTLTIDANDTRYVSIVNGKVVIHPSFDFDFTSDYEITVSAGAFQTAGDPANGIPASATAAVVPGTVGGTGTPGSAGALGMTFSTAAVGADLAHAVQAKKMSMDGAGVVSTVNSKKWFALTDGATPNVSTDDYAMVLTDTNTAGGDPTINDGVATAGVQATIAGFAAGDLIYVDDQKNDKTKLNDSKLTQIANYGTGGDQIVMFDGTTGGAALTLTGVGDSVDGFSTALRENQINISNSKTPTPTPITHIQRVDASGSTTIDNSDQYGLGISDAQPLRIKITAPTLKVGDKIQLSHLKTDGTTDIIGGAYTATDADVLNGYVTLKLTKTQLTAAANGFFQEDYNQVWATITNTKGAVSTSTLLGDDVDGGGNGFYLDFQATAPTINALSAADATLSSAEASVDLVVSKDKIKIGDTLTLKLGSTVLVTKVITQADVSNDVTLTALKSALAVGNNTLTLTNTDAQGNTASITQVITRSDFVTYSGTIGLGPAVGSNDLQVTAYDKNGVVLGTSNIAADGTYSLAIDKTQTGPVTLRVANKTAATAALDYWDEATNTGKDIGAGASIAAVTAANGANQTVHITTLTDLVARHLTSPIAVGATPANTITAAAADIAKYNLALTKALVNSAATDAATQGITSILPTFTVTNTGAATANQDANKYGQLLAQISKQAAVNGKTMEEMQTLISNAITWNDTSATIGITSTRDTAKQVDLFGKIAQAVALATGANASTILTAADITSYLDAAGTGALGTLSAARKDDLIARIVATTNVTDLDERTELVALTDKVVALAKIQDYAANSANAAPTVADFTAAGITTVTAANLTAVNTKLVGSSAATGSVPVDGIITLVVNAGIASQVAAVTALANYAKDNTKPVPSLSTYALAGVTGVTADNLAAINKKIDTTATLNAAAKTVANITLNDIQTEVTAGIGSYTDALKQIRAYVIDSTNPVTNPTPDATTYSNIGLDFINTAEEVASANYYLTQVMVNDNALPSSALYVNDAQLRAKLTAQNTAIAKIDAFAVDTGSTAPSPTFSDYQNAGLTISAGNVSTLNGAVKGKALTAVDTASELASLYSGLFAGVPSITSIVRSGVGTVPTNGGTFANDGYLNNAELTQAGQTVKFTINFDRGVSGVTAANFGLTDSSGVTLTFPTATTPGISVVQADTEGKVWTVTVSGFSTLTSDSLRLNLVNNTGISDLANPGTALSQSTYSAGQSYIVDKTNTVTLEDGANPNQATPDQAVTLSSATADNTFTVRVRPDDLRTGDVLTFSKTVGGTTTTLGAVTVTSGHLTTGVTYTVNKSDMGSGGGTVNVTSTDVAGNTATSSVTVTVNQYITIQGTIGLSSKLLASGGDLVVEAFDNNGVLLGTGTINATDSTYKLDVIKGTTGLVRLKVRSSGTGVNDYYDEGNNANGDLGTGASVSSTINIPAGDTATVKTANISLLTDLASRIIAREYPSGPTDAQVTAVNRAVTKLLLKLSTDDVAKVYDPITSIEPDYAVSNTGVDNAAATRYGNLLTQLSQQAQVKGSSLGVMLDNMATGISWNGTTSVATLNTDFAKEVVLLAKTQMAAALDSAPANIDAILSFQDLIDGGITGLSGLTSNAALAVARKADLINRIIATNNNGDDADAMTEIQALANKAVAIAKIQDYADLTAPTASQTPIVTDYSDAGVTGVTTDNLAAVNKVVLASSAAAIDDTTRQDLVNTGVALYTAAINTIKAYAAGGATVPTLDNYLDAGVASVTADNLSAVNIKVKAAAVATAADTTSEIKALAEVGIYNFGEAMTKIKNYITDPASATGVPDASTYKDAGLPTIDTAGEIESANQYLDQIMSGSPSNTSIISALSAQQAALLYINQYATSNTSNAGVAPTAPQYVAAGITSATNANLSVLNNLVDTAVVGATTTPADLSTFAKLKTLVDSVFATSPTLTSITTVGTSIVNGVYQTDSVLNKAELAGTLKFKLTFSRAVTGVDTIANFATNFALVDSGGNKVTGFTLSPSITTADGGLTWTVSVSGLTNYAGSELGLTLKNNTGIVDAVNTNALSTTTLAGSRYTIDTTFNEGTGTLSANIGQDLTLDGGETSVDLFVDSSKLKAGDTFDVFLGAGTTSLLGTPYTVTASDVLNGAKINLLKSALTAGDNSITLKHYDQSGNVGVQTGTVKVNSAVTYTGVFGAGPVTAGSDLVVSAYDKTGKLLSTADVNASTGRYSLTIDSTYSGPLLLRASSKTASGKADYIDEATNQAKDLGTYTLSAVVNATGVGQTVNITNVTDLAAKLLTTSDGMISSDLVGGTVAANTLAADKVTQVNTLVTKQFIDSTSSTVITAIDPQFTVGNTAGGAALTTANRYGQVLAQLSDIAAQSGQNLSYVQGRVAADLGYTYSAGGGTLSAGSLAKDVTFLAQVAQAAMLTSVDSTVLSAADITTYGGIAGFASLSAARKDDVVKRIVDGAADGSGTDSIAEITTLVAKVNAIGIIQDYAAGKLTSTTSSATAPTLETYLTAGFSTVTADKVAAVNKAVLGAASADMASTPDTTIATALTTGVTSQTTAQNFLVNFAKGGVGSTPTVQDYADAGISNVTATNLLAVNAKVFAIDNTTADATVKANLQDVVDSGVIATAAAVTVIRNYLASPATAPVPTLSNYIDANLDGGVITNAAQVANANYLLSKVLSSSLTDAALGAKLSAQVTAFNTLNAYAASGGTAPALSVYQDAGFSAQVTSANLAEINERVNAFASNTMTNTTDVLTVIKAIDLVAGTTAGTQLGIQTSTTPVNMFSSTAATATDLFSTVNASYAGDSDIKSITISITGAIDTANDQIIFGPSSGTKINRTLSTTAGSDADVTIGTVTGVSWSYSSNYSGSTGTAKLVFTKTAGGTFTAAEAQAIEKNLQFKTAGTTTVQGNRVFTLMHTDTAGVDSSSGASTLVLDTTTDAVDLDSATVGTQATNATTQYINAAQAVAGKTLVNTTVAAPTATDIKQLSIVMGGASFDANNAKLKLDVDRALAGDFSATGVTIGGITGLSYTYTASTKTLLISKTDGSNFTTQANIPTILGNVLFKSTSAAQGARTVTISYIDAGGNVGTSATSTLTTDTAISTPTVSLTTDDGASSTDKIVTTAGMTTNGLAIAGIDADSTYQVSLDSGVTWTAAATANANGQATLTSATTGLGALATAGAKTVLVKATDVAGNTATTSYGFTVAAPISKTVTITGATDAVSTNGSTITSVASGTTTDATASTLSGTVTALAAGEQVAIYDGVTRLGYSTATTGATSWTFALSGLSTGVHSFTARVENTSATVGAAGAAGTASAAYTLNIDPSLNMNVVDKVGLIMGSLVGNTFTSADLSTTSTTIGTNTGLSDIKEVVLETMTFKGLGICTNVPGYNNNGTDLTLIPGSADYSTAGTVKFWVSGSYDGGWYGIQMQLTLSGGTLSANAVAGVAPRLSYGATQAVSYSNILSNTSCTAQTLVSTSAGNGFGVTAARVTLLTNTDDTMPTFSGTLDVPLGTGEELAIFDGSTKLAGNLNFTGTAWTFTPTSALAAGAHTLKAMVHPITDTTGVLGRVVSVSKTITVSAAAITKTAVITSAVDNVNVNETITPSAVNTTTTDDTTPTLNGTVATVLGTYEQLAIYNGATRVGYATMSGTSWSFTPPALPAGQYTFTARVENIQTGAVGATSTQTIKVNIDPTLSMAISDDAASGTRQFSVGKARYIMLRRDATVEGGLDFNELQVMSNGVNVALNKAVATSSETIYAPNATDGSTSTFFSLFLGNLKNTWVQVDLGAEYDISSIVITPRPGIESRLNSTQVYYSSNDMSAGAANTTAATPPTDNAVLYNTTSATPVTTAQTLAMTAPTIEDTTPTFSGTLDVPLGTNEELAIYSGLTRLGAATITGNSWTFTPTTPLAAGTYSFKAMVHATSDTTGVAGRLVSATSANITIAAATTVAATATISTITDDVATNGSSTGTVASGAYTDDTTPTLSGTITGTLGSNQVAVYDTVNGVTSKLGYATVTGTTWAFTPGTALNVGSHSFKVAVENTSLGVAGTSSAAVTLNLGTSLTVASLTDDVGVIKGALTPTTYTSADLTTTSVTIGTNTGLTDIRDVPLENLTFKGLGTCNVVAGSSSNNGTDLALIPGSADYSIAGTVKFWVYGSYDGGWYGIQMQLTLSGGTLSANAVSGVAPRLNYGSGVQATALSNILTNTSCITQVFVTTSAGNGFGVTAVRVPVLSTDDATPTLSGALNQSFDSATEELAIWSMNNGVNTKLGTASVTGSTWTFTPTTDMAAGDYTFKAMVQAKGNNTFSAGRLVSATTNTVVINTALSSASTGVTIASLIDNDAGTGATVSSGSVGTPVTTALTAGTAGAISTDDATPTLTGNVGRALATGESLVLYDIYNGVTTKVGSTTAGSGLTTISTAGSGATTTWTFAPSASVGAGQHKYYAVVENALGVQGTVTSQYWVNVYDSASRAAMTINYVDNVAGANASTTGTVSLATPSFTDDARPSFSGSLPSSFALGNNEELALYKNVAGVYTLVGRSGASTLTITGTGWTVAESAATDLVAGQSTSYVLMVQTTGSTNATAGKVVSASSGALIYSTTAPSQTTTITTVADNEVGTGLASTQATDTFTKDTGGLPIAVSTDDATPTLAGTISTALYAGQQLAVYDTVNGVTTKVAGTVTGLTAGTGTAIGTGTSWTFTPTSNLSAGKHSFTARVESGTGEFAAYSTDARVVNVHTGLTMSLADDVGKTRTVSGATGMTTDDNLPTMSGILSADLGANEELAVYSSLGGAAYVRVTGTATVTGTSWTFTPSAILADGTYTFKAMVHDKSDVSATGAGRVVSVQSGAIVIDTASAALLTQTTTITGITDDLALNGSLTGTVGAGTTTDDTTPVLTGTISAVLAANQNVVVYDTVNGVTTQVAGTVTGVTVGTGTSWTFTPTTPLTAAQAGTHSFTARVENANSGAQAAVSNAYAVKVFTAGLDVSVTDNVGALQGTANYAAGVSSDDTTPTLSGSLSTVGGLSTGDEVAVYQTLNGVTTFSGVASVTGSGASLAWSYTPGTPLGVGDYTFKAMVQPTGDKTGAAGKVVATSQIVKVGATDTTFDAITSTTDTNVTTSSFKALSVASQMALDMNAYTHADFDVLNLQASATAKIDLADVVQGAKNLFTTAKFTTVSGAGLGDTTLLDQFLVNGNGTNALTFAGPATTWTNSGVVSNSGHQYDVYTSGTSQLLIDKDVVNRTGFTVI